MKRSSVIFSFIFLWCLLLSACGHTSSSTATPSGPQDVKVTIGDFYIHSSQTTFTTEITYHIVITNVGAHAHNFLIMHPMQTTMSSSDIYKRALGYFLAIAPKATKSVNYTFHHTAPKGMLEFACHYGGHYEAGMHEPIVVNAPAGASVSPYPNDGLPRQEGLKSSCDSAVMTELTNDAYNPSNVELKRGETLMVVNHGSQPYTPVVTPNAPIRLTLPVGGTNNTEYITFDTAGTYTLSSQEQPDTNATVSVLRTSGSTCGMTPTTTAAFDINYLKPNDPYYFSPTQVTIKKGQILRLSNLVDRPLSFISTPDAGLGKVKAGVDGFRDLAFMADGTYTISCVQFPTKKLTVTVKGA